MTDTSAYHRHDLSVDQQMALRTAAGRLRGEFDGVYGAETIERFLHTSYDQFAAHSTVPHYLPLLAERFARQRLTAQARIEGAAPRRPSDRVVPVRTQRRPQPDGGRRRVRTHQRQRRTP